MEESMKLVNTNIEHPHFGTQANVSVRELRNNRLLIITYNRSYVFEFHKKSRVVDQIIYSDGDGAFVGFKE
jgi:hypothetical protein